MNRLWSVEDDLVPHFSLFADGENPNLAPPPLR
jgi:hypothetical protein